MPGADCPTDAALAALLHSDALDAAARRAENHLSECANCQARLSELAGSCAAPLLPTILGDIRRTGESAALRHVMQVLVSPPLGQTPTPGNTVRQPRLERYEVLGTLGSGGMGAVFRARDPRLNRLVAIKVLRAPVEEDRALEERFLREAQAIASIRSDFVVSVYELGLDAHAPFLVMELVEGGSLADQLDADGPLPPARVLKLARELASALVAAHARGVVHRDVKPRNVLFDKTADRYKLTDFGLVKFQDRPSLTAAGMMAGTPEYMSPEQAEGRELDGRSDLFSLGCLLFAATTGASPFQAESSIASLMRVCRDRPCRLDEVNRAIPAWFADLVARLLRKNPSERQATAAEVLAELETRVDEEQTRRAIASGSRFGRRRVIASLAIVPLLGAAAVAWSLWPEQPASRPPRQSPAASGLPFRNVRAGEAFAALNEAVARARHGDTIEVSGDGPFACLPISLGDQSITIRAASANRPRLVFASSSSDDPRPSIRGNGRITLEGLELQCNLPPAVGDVAMSELLGQCAVACNGQLRVTNCEVRAGRRNTCIALAGGDVQLLNTRLVAPEGVGLRFRPDDGSRINVRNCIIEGRACATATIDSAGGGQARTPIVIERSSLRGEKALQLRGAGGPKQRLEVRASHTHFDVRHVLTFESTLRGQRALDRPTMSELTPRLTRFLAWKDDHNAYAADARFLAHATPRLALAEVSAGPADIAAWDALWGQSNTGSLEGEPPSERRGDFGADESLVGPGEAWRRWLAQQLDKP